MRRGSALIVLAGILSCTGRPDAKPESEAGAPPAAQTDTQPLDAPPVAGPDLGSLQGTWRVIGAWVEGRPSAINVKGRTWTFQDSTITTAADGKVDQEGTVSLDSTSSPARMDFFLKRDSGKVNVVRRQIYQLADDTLTVAYAFENSRESYPRSLDVTKGVVKLKLVRGQ
jgi:uncharacterized protein (TIGR03067 family)